MNVLVLMAGSSAGFYDAGYNYAKNLVEVEGLPLVEHVLQPVRQMREAGHTVVCTLLATEIDRFHTDDVIRLLIPDAKVVTVPNPTAGAACTSLLAIEYINSDDPLLILNGDQLVQCDLLSVVDEFTQRRLDGGVVVFEAVHPRWSFVRCNDDGLVIEAAEKRPISKMATAGTYFFSQGSSFVSGAMRMIMKGADVDGTYYVAPVFNELILANMRIGVHHIPRNHYVSLATPQSVEDYIAQVRSHEGDQA